MTRERDDGDVLEAFAPLFVPKSIAVVGASTSGANFGNEFIRSSLMLGFAGPIYPIHPAADTVEGLPAYRSLGETPEPIDYALIGVRAADVPPLLSKARGRVRYAQVVSSGFGEIAEGRDLQAALVRTAREGGMRLLGPNCLGTYSPRGRISYERGASGEVGPVAIISQSGGLSRDIILKGGNRGLRFSGIVSMGNSADLGPTDLLAYFLADPGTRVIGLYLESVRDGRLFADMLRQAGGAKPVVLLKGGRTATGRRAAMSHTGSLAGDARIWAGLARQTGSILVDTLDEFLDALLAFQNLTPREDRPTRNVVLFGNGGGTSVLAADCVTRLGLDVLPSPAVTRQALEALRLPPGTSIDNPIDAPSGALRVDEGRIAEHICEALYLGDNLDALVMHIDLPQLLSWETGDQDFLGNLTRAAARARDSHGGRTHFVLVLRSDGNPEIEDRKRRDRKRILAEGIPVYDEIPEAATALDALARYEGFRHARRR